MYNNKSLQHYASLAEYTSVLCNGANLTFVLLTSFLATSFTITAMLGLWGGDVSGEVVDEELIGRGLLFEICCDVCSNLICCCTPRIF